MARETTMPNAHERKLARILSAVAVLFCEQSLQGGIEDDVRKQMRYLRKTIKAAL